MKQTMKIMATGIFMVMLMLPTGVFAAGGTWTALSQTSSPTMDLRDIASDGTGFVAVASSHIWTSVNGINWDLQVSPAFTGFYKAITWNGLQYVAVGGGGPDPIIIHTSPDGITWTAQTAAGNGGVHDIIWDGIQFVIAGNGMETSPDAISWTAHSLPGGCGSAPTSIAWSGTQFVATGNFGCVYTSPDGATWTLQPPIPGAPAIGGIVWNGIEFLAISSDGSGDVFTSLDAISWTTVPTLVIVPFRDVLWDGTQYVATGDAGLIATSPDGVNWLGHNSGTADNLLAIGFNGSSLVVGGTDYFVSSTVVISSDIPLIAPSVNLPANGINFVPGETVTVSVTAVPADVSVNVDAYVTVQVPPPGPTLYLRPDLTLSALPMPVRASFILPPLSTVPVINYLVTGGEPLGAYPVSTYLTDPGLPGSIIGTTTTDEFNF